MGINVLGYQFQMLQRCHPACGDEKDLPIDLSSVFPYEFEFASFILDSCMISSILVSVRK